MRYFRAIVILAIIIFLGNQSTVLAEDMTTGTIPKLPKTANDPILTNGHVYPFWGPICQRYTYSVVYSDKEGRAPEYVKIYFNGQMIDMEKEDSAATNYKNGVKYIYKFAPEKYGSNFYYFEASNGLGKTRASIIDSPDNGPVLFDSDFKNNEIVLIDPTTGKEIWRYSTAKEWVGGVALSDDGLYLAVQTSYHIHFFETDKNSPVWSYESQTQNTIGGDVKGGVAISSDGEKIFGAINGKALMFDKKSNKPVWTYNLEDNGGSAYGVDIAKNGQFAAVAMAGAESDQNSNVLLMFNAQGEKLWQYHASGNWHEVNLSADGAYVTGATGCPDRRGYLFSKDSNNPIFKSEPLSKESPIDEARISSDGSLIVFGVESGYGAVVLMDKFGKQIWKYNTEQAKSVRALAITPDGNTIGAATFGGDVLIFDKNSNQPRQNIKINSAIGAFDISTDGSIFATGSADKKVRIFNKDASQAKAEITLSEYIGELDLSANGKYLVAGTSGAVYFFETIMDLDDVAVKPCGAITEPEKETTNLTTKPSNNTSSFSGLSLKLIVSSIASILIIVFLGGYIVLSRRHQKPPKKWLIIILILGTLFSLGFTVYFYWPTKTQESNPKTKNACGDSICEPNGGETKENCPKDCSGGNQ